MLVEVSGLARTFLATRRRPGLIGAIRDLVAPEREAIRALDGVTFAIAPGETVGLLGPNGAGKSTTVKCLAGLLAPTSGSVRVAGRDPFRERSAHVREIGVVFGQRTQLWWDLAVREAFDLLAAVFDVPDAEYRARLARLDGLLGLAPLLTRQVRDLSLGERTRCDLAASLLHAPRLLLLDEPTIGLDVAVRRDVRAFLRALAGEGTSVLLTSHDLGDVEQVCDRVIVIDAGRVAFDGGFDGLRARSGLGRVVAVEVAGALSDEDLAGIGAAIGHPVARRGEGAFAVTLGAEAPAGALVAQIVGRVAVADLAIEEPSTEAVVAALWEGPGGGSEGTSGGRP